MKKKRVVFLIILIIIAILWILGIYKLSSMNTTNSNDKSSGIISVFIEDTLELTNKYGITDSHPDEAKLEKASLLLNTPLRKAMHAGVYFVLAFMIIFIVNYLFKNKKILISMIITLVLVILAAGFDEYHQTFVDGRTGAVRDVLIDTLGGVVGIMFYSSYYFTYEMGYRKHLKDTKDGEIREQKTKKEKNKDIY